MHKAKGAAEKAARLAFERIAFLEDVMSDYRPTSEVMQLCSKAGGRHVPVSKELLFVLKESTELARRSDGAFDVTIGPLIKLWRESRKSGMLPSKDEIFKAKRLVGWRKIIIDEKAGTVKLAIQGMRIDLGGIAKGYACDEAIKILKQQGIKRALVEMGGDIVIGDPPPKKEGWTIEIANADMENRTMLLSNCAISSSGDAEQFVEIGGVRYSHIVDPRTGVGLTNRIAVTVIAPSGIIADGLATAISVLGEEKGRLFAKSFPFVSIYIRKSVN